MSNNRYTIRIIIIFLILAVLYCVVIGRLYVIQVLYRDFYIHVGEQQYSINVQTLPPRSLILDRHGNPLALNRERIAAFIVPNALQYPEKVEPFLARHFPSALKRLHGHPSSSFMYIKRTLTPHDQQLIEKSNITDIHLLQEPHRFYPIQAAAPIVGLTDIDNKGLFGIEQLYNEQLAGKSTSITLEREARSGHFYFAKETVQEGTEGASVKLTIDGTLQFLAFEELKDTIQTLSAQEGGVIVMDPTNGDILAMAVYPTFNPNDTHALDIATTKNRILTDVHELGSVMKTFVALAALEEHLVTPDELIDCQSTKNGVVNGAHISTWKEHGKISFSEVIEHSNNIGVALVALRLGPKLYEHYRKLGFGSSSKLNWPGEQKGFVNPPERWSKPSIVSLSFGYEITANLLQLARAFSIIANHGKLVQPRLILPEQAEEPHTEQLYSAEAIDQLRDILTKTVTQGTAHKAAIKGYTVMGKTGTANLVINGKYDTDHNVYVFAAIVEHGNYKRVIITFVKDAVIKTGRTYASTMAVPLFEHVAERMLINDKIIA